MRILGWASSLLLVVGFAGCGAANSLEEGIPEDAPYVPPPKIEFAKPKRGHSAKPAAPAAPSTTETKKQ